MSGPPPPPPCKIQIYLHYKITLNQTQITVGPPSPPQEKKSGSAHVLVGRNKLYACILFAL